MSDTSTPSWEPTSTSPPPSGGTEAVHLSPVARLGKMFFSPKEVFADVARKPGFVLPIILIALIAMTSQILMFPKLDFETAFRAQMAKRDMQMDDEQVERALEMQGKIMRYMPYLSLIITPIVFAFIAALFFLGLKLVGSDAGYPGVLGVTAYSYWPSSLVSSALTIAVAWKRTSIDPRHAKSLLASNVGAFLPEDTSAPLLAFAQSIDLFSIWIAALLVIGLATVGKVKTGKAAWVVGVAWGAYIALKIAFAALGVGQ